MLCFMSFVDVVCYITVSFVDVVCYITVSFKIAA